MTARPSTAAATGRRRRGRRVAHARRRSARWTTSILAAGAALALAASTAAVSFVGASSAPKESFGTRTMENVGQLMRHRHDEGSYGGSGPLVTRRALLSVPRGGAGPSKAAAAAVAAPKVPRSADPNSKAAAKSKAASTSSKSVLLLPSWFRPNRPLRERQLSAALLVWNALAIVDAVRFTLFLEDNLRGYFVEAHQQLHPQVIVVTRFLANCQWAYLATSVLVALTSSNVTTLRAAFGIAIVATLGAFRAVAMGIADHVVKAPWKSKYASLLTLPPLLLLSYFAFWF